MTNSPTTTAPTPAGEIARLLSALKETTGQVREATSAVVHDLEPVRAITPVPDKNLTVPEPRPPTETPLGQELQEILGCVEETRGQLEILLGSLRL